MPLPSILTDEEQHDFDYPPILSPEERAVYFCMTPFCEGSVTNL